MSQVIQQAVNQVRLTNVAIVRLKRHGKRFEIACYKNKVLNWRSKTETDIEEVLQIDRVFHNVSKGVVAKDKDLLEAFGTNDQEQVCRMILDKGMLQVSEKERMVMNQNMFKNVATIVCEKCLNPQTMRPYPVSTIETAMKETIHFAVVPNRSAKQQALEVIKQLEKCMPLKRAQMLVKTTYATSNEGKIEQHLKSIQANILKKESTEKIVTLQLLIDPGNFGIHSEYVVTKISPSGTVEVKDFSVQEDKEVDVESAKQIDLKTNNNTNPLKQESEQVDNKSKKKESDSTNKKNINSRKEDLEVTDAYSAQVDQLYAQKQNKKKKKKQQRRAAKKQQEEQDEAEKQSEIPPVPPSKTSVVEQEKQTVANDQEKTKDDQGKPKDGLKCLTCQSYFGNDRKLHREHYKSDLHRINLKLKMRNIPCMSEDEFTLLGVAERDSILHDYS